MTTVFLLFALFLCLSSLALSFTIRRVRSTPQPSPQPSTPEPVPVHGPARFPRVQNSHGKRKRARARRMNHADRRALARGTA